MTQSNQPARQRGPAVSHGDDPTSPSSRQGGRSRGNAVSATVARQIDENLKRLYNQHVEQELPPELQALVARLREGQRSAEPAPDATLAASDEDNS